MECRLGDPKVSVILPCFNYGRFVEAAIKSVLSQSYPDFELIVVDDGSSDDSVVIIENLQLSLVNQGKPGFVFIKQKNQGVSGALNTGLKHAQGEFVATFDADDIMPENRLELQVEHLLNEPSVGLVGGRTLRLSESGTLIPRKNKAHAVKKYNLQDALANAVCMGLGSSMWRKEALLEIGGYDAPVKIPDLHMVLKVASAGWRVDEIPGVVTYYRIHGDSMSSNYKLEYFYSMAAMSKFKDCPGYTKGVVTLKNKVLRESVKTDKRYALKIIMSIPLHQWNSVTWKRLRQLLTKFSG